MKIDQINLLNAQETQNLGQTLAKNLNNEPALIFLRGEMGAGKTTLAKGFIGWSIAYRQQVLSPTYAYMQKYQNPRMIYHFDLYRIENSYEIAQLGLECIISDETAIKLIEWPEKLEPYQFSPTIDITLSYENTTRKALIEYF
jgi:tRNA threonylcarbamoyladenosine biosynthesis protein TsaE